MKHRNIHSEEEHIIFHIDVNSAFLSWSALKLLGEGAAVDLRTVPAIVGGDQKTRHGIVVAKSIPAKAFGIHTAETVASALKKCPDLVMVPPDHAYYREKSRRLMAYLSEICPQIEQVSIDECYMDYEPIRGKYGTPEETAAFLKDSVCEKFGFTVNVGVSDCKVLAKMASDFKKPNLVHTLYVREIEKKLWPLPIDSLHMCGKSSAALLKKMGIRTIGDLAQTDLTMVESWLKSHGRLLWEYANGVDDSAVVSQPAKAKGVGNSTTISHDVTTAKEAYEILRKLAESVSGRLKKKQFLARQVSTEIKYATFQSVSHQTTLLSATADAQEIYRQACGLFDELWDGGAIRLLGIRTTKLEDEGEPVQMNLFDFQKEKERSEKQKRLDEALKKIRDRYGEEAVQKGCQ